MKLDLILQFTVNKYLQNPLMIYGWVKHSDGKPFTYLKNISLIYSILVHICHSG